MSTKRLIYCSFCGKSQNEVKKLIAGPSAFVCDECVHLMLTILDEEGLERPPFPVPPPHHPDERPMTTALYAALLALTVAAHVALCWSGQ